MKYTPKNPADMEGDHIQEVLNLIDFNNMHGHLPRGFCREFTEDRKERHRYIEECIDDFIERTHFDEAGFWEAWDKDREKSQEMLCEMYIHLRKCGFDRSYILG